MHLLIIAVVIAVVWLAVVHFFGDPSGGYANKVVWFVVFVLVLAWFLCFLGVWCPGQKV